MNDMNGAAALGFQVGALQHSLKQVAEMAKGGESLDRIHAYAETAGQDCERLAREWINETNIRKAKEITNV